MRLGELIRNELLPAVKVAPQQAETFAPLWSCVARYGDKTVAFFGEFV